MESKSNTAIPRLDLKKTYEFFFKDIHFEMTEDEAKNIRNIFVQMFPVDTRTRIIPAERTSVSKWRLGELYDNKMSSSSKTRTVPPEFVEIGRKESEQTNGTPKHTFVYYKDPLGNYGYKIVNGNESSFKKIGKIDDASSRIGRFYGRLPVEELITKRELTKKHLAESGDIKAFLDILCIENQLTNIPSPNDKRRSPAYYKSTSKPEGVELDNNSGLRKVQVIPNPSTSSNGVVG